MEKRKNNSLTKKICFLLVLMFTTGCLRVCAEQTTLTPGQAQILREKFVEEIKTHIGAPYEFGAVGPDAFDCSGLIYYSAQKAIKVQLPRTAKAIYNYAKIIPEDKREIGDLLFFKTTNSGTISHVGVYIGNNQFISAISDGQNTGVIVSSLMQDYWKGRYVSTGQFLASGRDDYSKKQLAETDVVSEEDYIPGVSSSPKKQTSKSSAGSSSGSKNLIQTSAPSKKSFEDSLVFDSSLFFDWSLLSPRQFVFKYRGIDTGLHVSYTNWKLSPGAGFFLRFNAGLNTFQIPLVVSLSMNDLIRVYAGPVINFGKATLIDSEKKIKGSFFPGIIGVSFSTPQWNIGKVSLQAVQDVNYTVYNRLDGAALPFMESLASGLVMYTGIKVSVPLSAFYSWSR